MMRNLHNNKTNNGKNNIHNNNNDNNCNKFPDCIKDDYDSRNKESRQRSRI